MIVLKILKRNLIYKGLFFLSVLFLSSTSLFSQEDFLKKLDKEFEEFVNEQDSLFNIYSTDFLQWKDFVDLKKIRLEPEKAVVNEYKEVVNYRDKVTNEVIKYIGVPYLWGGDNPSAFDCSGLVQWTIKKTHNILIPRTTKLQYNKWSTFFIYDLFKIKPGDIVYFKTYSSNPVSHVGIYVGDNSFIHAPNQNENVMISKIDGYWRNTFVGFLPIEIVIEI
jgi:hypothetical protein|tara:strand:- start:31 stop:693 length:663 start_codon:yes stop_codon:yes gene_type:complete